MLEGIVSRSKPKKLKLRDAAEVFYREWKGKKDADVIVYLHGLESHTGWFTETAGLLNAKGFNVYGVDRRGSGMNNHDRGHMENYWVLVDDIKEAVALARREHPNSRFYLMGLCWGGKTAVTFSAFNKDAIDGLILITPAVKSKVDLTLIEKLDVIISNYLKPRKLLDVPLDERIFTKNPKYVEFIKSDKFKLKKATARFFFETGKMNLHFDRIASRIHVPVLVLLAGQDVVVDNEGIEKWFKKVASRDKTIKLYKDCMHSLLFEDTKNPMAFIADWINARS